MSDKQNKNITKANNNTNPKMEKVRFIEKQITDFKNKNIYFEDFDFAREKLLQASVAHLQGFGLQWMDKTKRRFNEGTTFEMLWSVYQTDRILKDFLFDYLSEIEVQFRSIIGGVLSEAQGPFGYKDFKNFRNDEYHENFIEDARNELKRENEPFVHYYNQKFQDEHPIYLLVEVVSFGTLSKLYSNMLRKDQKEVAKYYGIKSEQVLASFFYAFTKLRNTCAHHGRLYNRTFSPSCAILKEDLTRMKSLDPEFSIDPNYLFAIILAMCHVMNEEQKGKLIHQLKETLVQNDIYELALIGFPIEWEAMLIEAGK